MCNTRFTALICLLLQVAFGKLEIDVYRLLQFKTEQHIASHNASEPDLIQVQNYGSQQTLINSAESVHFQNLDMTEIGAKVVVVAHLKDLNTIEAGRQIIQLLHRPALSGVLILLPGQEAPTAEWNTMFENMIRSEVPTAVYFAFETSEISEWYAELKKHKANSDQDKMTVSLKSVAGQVKTIDELNLDIFYVLQDFESKGKPIILISASYDAMGIAPSLPAGVEASVSPTLALLYLSRVFCTHLNQLKSDYDLMFVLTPSSSLGYPVTSQYLEFVSGGIQSRIQLAICLDRLLDSTKDTQTLYVYDSNLSVESELRNKFVQNLKRQVLPVVEKGVLSRTPATNVIPFLPFEHIAYAESRVPSFTITASQTAAQTLSEKYSILDTSVCPCKLFPIIEAIGEAIAQTIASENFKGIDQILEPITEGDKDFLRHMRNWLSIQSRSPMFIDRDSELNLELFRILGLSFPSQPKQSIYKRLNVRLRDFKFVRESSNEVLLQQGAGRAILTAKLQGSSTPDLVVFLASGAYLVLIYGAVSYFSDSKEKQTEDLKSKKTKRD